MKKILVIAAAALVAVTILAVGVLALAGLTYLRVRAAQPTPAPYGSFGPGMMGRWNNGGGDFASGRMGAMLGGRMGGRGGRMGGNPGQMHSYMINALAKELDLKVEEVQARVDKGETPWQIIQSTGKTDAQALELMNKVHETALAEMVKANVITQQQADWMEQRHEQMQKNFPNGMPCQRGGRFPAATPQPTN